MGSSMRAGIAWGVSLGGDEQKDRDALILESDEWGYLSDAWDEAHGIDEDDPERELGDVLEEAILVAAGFTTPEPEYVRSDSETEWDRWYRAKNEAGNAYGVSVEFTGGTDRPGHLLVITETAHTVSWREVFRIEPRALLAEEARGPEVPSHTDRWNEKLAAVLKAAGLTLAEGNQPGWIVWTECDGDH